MKKPLILILLSLWTFLQLRAQDPIIAKSTITDVTVYLSGAQVSEEATLSLKAGENTLLFTGLAQNIDPRSIQAVAPEIVLINSVRHEVNYLVQLTNSPRVQRLQDSLKLIAERLEVLGNEGEVLTQEQDMILANQSLVGEAKGVTSDDLRKAADFFRSRLHDIADRLLTNTRAQTKLNEQQARITQQLDELNASSGQPTNDIVVKVKADNARTVRIGIRYFVPDAGWVPGYDLRAKDTDSPITIDYRADVWQNTGVPWKDVTLTLSSGDPLQGGTKPELAQWNLAFATGYAYGIKGGRNAVSELYDQEQNEILEEDSKSDGYDSPAKTLADYTLMRNTATTAEFAISVKQDVPSDGKKQQVSVQSATLPAVYAHYAVPKLDKDAFLVARITGWESLNLLPGSVNIFFEGTYVTEAFLDPTNTIDTLDFSLGRDKKVIIERNLLKDYNDRKDIGTNKERTWGYEFVVRNTKKSVVHLKLMDQLPVTQDADIIVKEIELSGANKDEATGELTWNLDLQPAATQKFKLAYSVKYPKKKIVTGI
jgi:uncharacterized protein (TIGR02231 family)